MSQQFSKPIQQSAIRSLIDTLTAGRPNGNDPPVYTKVLRRCRSGYNRRIQFFTVAYPDAAISLDNQPCIIDITANVGIVMNKRQRPDGGIIWGDDPIQAVSWLSQILGMPLDHRTM